MVWVVNALVVKRVDVLQCIPKLGYARQEFLTHKFRVNDSGLAYRDDLRLRAFFAPRLGQDDVNAFADHLYRHLHRNEVSERAVTEVEEEAFAVPQFDHDAGAGWDRVGGAGVLPMNETRISFGPSSSACGKNVFAFFTEGSRPHPSDRQSHQQTSSPPGVADPTSRLRDGDRYESVGISRFSIVVG